MSGISLDSAKEANEQANEGNLRSNDAGIPDAHRPDYDNDTVISAKGHAESLITFSHIANISIVDYGYLDDNQSLLDLRENLADGGQYGFDVEITVADPEIIDGELWVDDPDADFPDYKVLGSPENETNDYELREEIIKDEDGNPVDTEIKGVNLGGSNWDGKPVSEIDDDVDPDFLQVTVRSSRAANLLGALDTAGKWSHDRDGAFKEGVLEAPPQMRDDSIDYDSDDHPSPRVIGYPELRADMVGQTGAIAWTFGDETSSGNTPVNVNVYKIVEDEDGEPSLEALVPVTPEDEAYAKPTYPRTSGLYWDHEGDGIDADAGADAEPSTNADVTDAQAAMSDDGPSLSDLSEDAQEFVSDAHQAMSAAGYESVSEFGDFDERVQQAKADGTIDADADTLATIIDETA